MHRSPRRARLRPALLRIPVAFLVVFSAGLLGAGGCQAPGDWCSAIVVRPDQRFRDSSSCDPVWSDGEIAQAADVVLIGDFTEVSQPVIPTPGRRCNPSPSHVRNAAYATRLRVARARTGRTPLAIVHLARFDLVPATYAAMPGFDADFILKTRTRWSDVTSFFAEDESDACTPDGCAWSDSWGGNASYDPGRRIRDFIDREGGSGTYPSRTYYLARPDGTGTYWPTAAIADLRNPAYRAWRVAEARRAILAGGYDMVDLNQKLQQFRAGQHWIGGSFVSSVSMLNLLADTYWTAQPDGYGYAEYVAGWHALALDLAAARVPFAVTLPHQVWTSSKYDDPATPAVDEAELLRDAAERAALVMVDVLTSYTDASWSALAEQIASHGARVIRFDQSCPVRQ